MNKDIEHYAKACRDCATEAQDQVRVPLHQWEGVAVMSLAESACRLFKGKMWLLLIDAFSKWPEIHEMKTTTAEASLRSKGYQNGSFQTMVHSLLLGNLKI